MKKKIIGSVVVIILMAALVGGATMAWFTNSAEGGDAVFTAGTVIVESEGATIIEPSKYNNWNPGDTDEVMWEFVNAGTKTIKIRFNPSAIWGITDAEGNFVPSSELSSSNVTATLTQESIDAGWVIREDGIYYYNGIINSGEKISLHLTISLDGPSTGNEYQGMNFVIAGIVEAVQASHGAAEELWPINNQDEE